MRVRNRLAMGIVGVLPLLGAAPRCGRERNEKCSMPARACDLRSVRVKNHVCGITHFDRIRKKMEADRASLLLIRQDPAKSEDPAKKILSTPQAGISVQVQRTGTRESRRRRRFCHDYEAAQGWIASCQVCADSDGCRALATARKPLSDNFACVLSRAADSIAS